MDCRLPGFSVHGFSRQEFWSGLPFPSPGYLPNPGIESRSPALWADTLPSEPPGKLVYICVCVDTHTHTHAHTHTHMAHSIKETSLQCRRPDFNPRVGKIPWRKEWISTSVFLPGKFHEQRSPVGYSPWDHKELDTTEAT